MRRDELTAGEHYAWSGGRAYATQRVEVLDTRPRPRPGGQNGVTCRFVTGPRAGDEAVLAPRDFDHPWEVEERIQAAREERRREREDRTARLLEVQAALESWGISSEVRGLHPARLTLELDAAERLVARLEGVR